MTEEILEAQEDRPRAEKALALAIVGSALFAALVIPEMRHGLGTTMVAFAVAASVAAGRPVGRDPVTLLYAGAALVLAAMAPIRAAEWLVALDLLFAGGLATLAVARSVRWREMAAAPLRVVRKLVPAAPFVLAPLAGLRGSPGRLTPVLRGVALGAVLLTVFGALFASADRAFAEFAGRFLVPDLDLGLDVLVARVVVFGAVLVGAGALVLAGRRYGADTVAGSPRQGGVTPAEWMTALGLLDLLFLAFVGVQLTVLFGGRSHVLATTGLTYAEYARQGFFQLAAVGALTFMVVAGAVRWSRRDSERHTRVLQVLLAALIVLAVVVLASALRRLGLYESTFGYTRLRVSVHATILWMGAIFVVLLIAGVTMRARWLPAAVVTLTAGALISFTLADPERLVARHNVERFQATGQFDLRYARSLGADAVPEMVALPAGVRCFALAPIAESLGLERDDPFLEWNLARARARDELRSVPPLGCNRDELEPFPGVHGVRL